MNGALWKQTVNDNAANCKCTYIANEQLKKNTKK